MPDNKDFSKIAQTIWKNLVDAQFSGSDPYDGLNSQLLRVPLEKSRFLRLLVIQGVKRSPVNLRPLLRIPPGLNPKGLALVLQGISEWDGFGDVSRDKIWLGDALLSLASTVDGKPVFGTREIQPGIAQQIAENPDQWPAVVGWGYDFPWQSKAFLHPAFAPTVVASSFILDGLEQSHHPTWKTVAPSCANFVANHLHMHRDNDGICFSYSPGDKTRVLNASLFGGRILAQCAPLVEDKAEQYREMAIASVDWVVSRQSKEGSWIYGEADHWQWIDNLHTGFNLETINRIAQLLKTDRWDESLHRGLQYYRSNLFLEDGTPKYYNNRLWPLDPHSFAQGALTFLRLSRFDDQALPFAEKILLRGIAELWDAEKGGFQFQKQRLYSQKIIHMRWSQAWMFRALCAFLGSS